MRFYLITTDREGTLGCELTKRAAIKYAEDHGYHRDEIEVTPIDVDVTAENIRRLIGNLGGYAK